MVPLVAVAMYGLQLLLYQLLHRVEWEKRVAENKKSTAEQNLIQSELEAKLMIPEIILA